MTALLPPGPGEFDAAVAAAFDAADAARAAELAAAKAALCAAGRHHFRRDGDSWQCLSCPERRPFGGRS